jgi:hypothetical protein
VGGGAQTQLQLPLPLALLQVPLLHTHATLRPSESGQGRQRGQSLDPLLCSTKPRVSNGFGGRADRRTQALGVGVELAHKHFQFGGVGFNLVYLLQKRSQLRVCEGAREGSVGRAELALAMLLIARTLLLLGGVECSQVPDHARAVLLVVLVDRVMNIAEKNVLGRRSCQVHNYVARACM